MLALATPFMLKAEADAGTWRAHYLRCCCELYRRTGVIADPGCSDWTRLFRLPHATRDEGGKPEELETIGNPARLGLWDWTPGDLAADIATAEEMAKVAPEWAAAVKALTPAPPREPWKPSPRSAAGFLQERWAEAALEGEVARVSAAVNGTRDITINSAAFSLGQIVGAGQLSRARVEDALTAAALSTGQPEQEIRRALKSGLDAGEKVPRGHIESARTPPPRAAPASGPPQSGSPPPLREEPKPPPEEPKPPPPTPDLSMVPRLLTLDDVSNPPHENFVLGALFAFGKASVIYGPSGCGKSTFLSQLAFKVAAGGGGSFLDMLMHDQEGAPVLVLTLEDTFEDWKHKAAACLEGCKEINVEQALTRLHIIYDPTGEARLTELVTVRDDLGGGQSVTRHIRRPTPAREKLIEVAQEIGPRLILVETVSRLVDDEENPTLAALQSAAGDIAARTGAAVVLSHHPTKNASKENDSRAESARGGGALIANSRGAVALFPADEKVLADLEGRGFSLAPDDVMVLSHEKGTSSVRKQKPITLVRCSTQHGGVFKLPVEVAASPRYSAAHAAKAAEEAASLALRFAALYDKVHELKACGAVSKNKLRPFGKEFGCSKNNTDVDAFVDRAVIAGVLKIGKVDKSGRVLDLELGVRPGPARAETSGKRATLGDPTSDRSP